MFLWYNQHRRRTILISCIQQCSFQEAPGANMTPNFDYGRLHSLIIRTHAWWLDEHCTPEILDCLLPCADWSCWTIRLAPSDRRVLLTSFIPLCCWTMTGTVPVNWSTPCSILMSDFVTVGGRTAGERVWRVRSVVVQPDEYNGPLPWNAAVEMNFEVPTPFTTYNLQATVWQTVDCRAACQM